MSAQSIVAPFEYFTGSDGAPLDSGYIYIGTAGQNPETNPVSVYWDSSLSIPAAQPIRTVSGYPSRSGSAAMVYVDADDYSVTVRDRNGSLVFSSLRVTKKITSGAISYTPAGTGAVATTVRDKLLETVSVEDFMSAAMRADVAAGTALVDISSAFGLAVDHLATTGGGKIIFAQHGPYLWDTAISKTTTDQIVVDGNGAEIQLGSTFAYNGANYDTPFLTLQGNGPATPAITSLYRNFAIIAAGVSAKKGDLITIYRTDVTWGGASKDYVHSHTVQVDYVDSVNGIITWLPDLEIPIPVSNATTGLLDSTNVLMRIYNDGCNISFGKGIKFVGGATGAASGGQGAYQDGILLSNGRFKVESDFYGIASAVRASACYFYHSGDVLGSYEQAQGHGIKIDGPAIAHFSGSNIYHCRHAIQLGGGTIYDVSARLDGVHLGSTRQSYAENSFPGTQLGSLDLHGGARDVRVSNSEIFCIQQSAGKLWITNTKIVSQAEEPLNFFVDGTSGPDNGECHIVGGEVRLAPRSPSKDASPPTGNGTFPSTTYYSKHGAATGGSGWIFSATGVKWGTQDKATWPASTDATFQPGNHLFKRVSLSDCEFDFDGCGIRRLAIDPYITGGEIHWNNNRVYGAGVIIGLDSSIGRDYEKLFVDGGLVQNLETTSGHFATTGFDIKGTTASITNLDVIISDIVIQSVGTTALLTMDACPSRYVEASGITAQFLATSGTCGIGIRTSRNATATGSEANFIAKVTNNTVQSLSGVNTITAGIQINGLNSGGSLPAGSYIEHGNVVKSATTPFSYTGNDQASGDARRIATGLYSFTAQGGAQGSFTLGNLPDNATITRAWYEVITPFTSGGAATVALGVTTDDAVGIKAATAYNDASYGAGYNNAIPDGTAANFTTKTTAARTVVLTVATADLTAGKIRVWWEYVMSE